MRPLLIQCNDLSDLQLTYPPTYIEIDMDGETLNNLVNDVTDANEEAESLLNENLIIVFKNIDLCKPNILNVLMSILDERIIRDYTVLSDNIGFICLCNNINNIPGSIIERFNICRTNNMNESKKFNKKQLYENIMRSVSKTVKKHLNESYYDEDDF